MEVAKETKFGTSLGDKDDARMSNTRIAQRKRAIPHSTMKHIATYDVCCGEGAWNMTSVVVTALCNQPEAFASDLGDDQSLYLYNTRLLIQAVV